MSESLLDAAQGSASPPPATPLPPGHSAALPPDTGPEPIPARFWDAQTGTVRLDDLLRSYRELEQALTEGFAPPASDAPPEQIQRFRQRLGVPADPSGYEITARHDLCGPDTEVNGRLHAAHFTPTQAQLVYDLAAERLVPVVAEAAAQYEARRQLDKLQAAFGGEERFAQLARQIGAWGRANLPPTVFEALSTTAEGVTALHGMMQKGEPSMARSAAVPEPADEEGLRRMMRDPRYWRSREPEFVKRVTDGFRRLTGG